MVRIVTIIALFVFTNALSQTNFPDGWIGRWKGNLEIMAPDGTIKQTHAMQINISKLPEPKKWQWQIVYDDKDIRNYEIIEKDAAKGHYILDEKNNIVIDVTVFGNIIFSNFEVQGTRIFDTHRLIDNTIVFELNTSKVAEENSSGNGTKEIPTVKSLPQTGYQKAVLVKQN